MVPVDDEKVEKKKESKGGDESKDRNFELAKAFSTAIATEKPNVKWDDIAGLKKAKYVLQEAIILPSKFPQLFVGKLRPWGGILLYGPPGTGKSFLVKACGSEVQARFFSVNLSDLITK